jgi:hypothetical protein
MRATEEVLQSNSDLYQPRPEHKFTCGLWTVGNRGRAIPLEIRSSFDVPRGSVRNYPLSS